MKQSDLRLATEEDIDDLLLLCQSLCLQSPVYKHQPFDATHTRHLLHTSLANPRTSVILVGTHGDDRYAGFLVGVSTQSLFNPTYMAMEPAWYVKPEYASTRMGKDLLEAFEVWARRVGCSYVRVGKVYTGETPPNWLRRGYRITEIEYMKELR